MASNHNLPPIYPSKDVERDPYSWNKVSSYVSHEDWQTINSVAAQSGAISFIIDHAIHTTAVAIREHRLVPIIDTPRFFQWLRQRTTSEPPGTSQVAAGNVPGRVEGARQPTSHVAHVVAGPRTDVETGKGRVGRKARTGKA